MGLFSLDGDETKKKSAPAKKDEPVIKDNEVLDISQFAADEAENKQLSVLAKGIPDIKELIAPPSFELHHEEYLKVGNKWVRSFYLESYPNYTSVGWMDDVYNSPNDLDVTVYIDPIKTSQALQEINNQITAKESQKIVDQEKGNITNLGKLSDEIDTLLQQRRKLEQSTEKIFLSQLFINLYADSEREMKSQSGTLTDFFDSKDGAKVLPLYMREDKAYKSTIPYGKTYITDKHRNVNTGQLTALFPFYNSEINHIHGVVLGVNMMTANNIAVDFYNRKYAINSNINVFGMSGSGKTFFTSLFTLRSVLRGVRTVIIDPEDEYYALTEAMGGAVFDIAAGSNEVPNPFDVEEEEYFNKTTNKVEKKFDLKSKVLDVLNLIKVMYPNISDEQAADTEEVIRSTYEARGFVDGDPRTLYEENSNPISGNTITLGKQKREMPTFTDFWLMLKAQSVEQPDLVSEVKVLRQYRNISSFGLFDTQTPEKLEQYEHAPIVTFNVNGLEENTMRPIGMFVILQWVWEKFGKKMYGIKKRVVVDEAWMLLDHNFSGHEYTAKMLQTMTRRFRKLNAGLLCASQNFTEFTASREGRAVLTNAYSTIFFKQNSVDYEEVTNFFHLSEAEGQNLVTAVKGQFLLKIGTQSYLGYVTRVNQFELDLLNAKIKQQQNAQGDE